MLQDVSARYPFIATYMMANRRHGYIYLGSTNDLRRRAWEHREGVLDGFTREHGCTRLVWFEQQEMMTLAIQRELTMKHWRREWKVNLIERENPFWEDLYAGLA